MPNIYVLGLEAEQTRMFSRTVTDWFAREFRTPRSHVYVFHREGRVFCDGEDAPMPTIVTISWIRRSADDFDRASRAISAIMRREFHCSAQIELHEKWDDASIDGQLCSDWARANRPPGAV